MARVDVDEGLYRKLEEVAKKDSRDVHELVNEAIDAYLNRRKPPVSMAPKGYGMRPEERNR
ncbi:MAG: hypothetical protein C5B51_26350 [Terriglobia bacterium]|nr:MAG: hypothetical protein C5B51_26350 [Terriglobia bacterium]